MDTRRRSWGSPIDRKWGFLDAAYDGPVETGDRVRVTFHPPSGEPEVMHLRVLGWGHGRDHFAGRVEAPSLLRQAEDLVGHHWFLYAKERSPVPLNLYVPKRAVEQRERPSQVARRGYRNPSALKRKLMR